MSVLLNGRMGSVDLQCVSQEQLILSLQNTLSGQIKCIAAMLVAGLTPGNIYGLTRF